MTRTGLRSEIPTSFEEDKLPGPFGTISTGIGNFRNYPRHEPGIAYSFGWHHHGVGRATKHTNTHTGKHAGSPGPGPGYVIRGSHAVRTAGRPSRQRAGPFASEAILAHSANFWAE